MAGTALVWSDPSENLQIFNFGTIESLAGSGRAIDGGASLTGPRNITLTNGETGIIRSENDAFRINFDITDGFVNVLNSGTILSSVDGQAIDFDAVSSTTDGQIRITNSATGIIRSTNADAIRPGARAIVTNEGLIDAGSTGNLSSDGVDWQGHSGTVINLAGGVITGARHGITADTDVYVVNYGTITGRNGSGVGSDGSATVINYGRITGAYDGSGVGDGDGIDIDSGGHVENFGIIEALGFAGVKSDGRSNGSDGVTIGGIGGTVINHEGAMIFSVGGAVPMAAGTVVNDGTIMGLSGVLFGEGAGTLVNTGTISGTDAGYWSAGWDDTVINSGTITSEKAALYMGAGDDHLILRPGSVLIGSVSGGPGADRITLEGEGSGIFDSATDFETLDVTSGQWSLIGASTFADGATVSGGTLVIEQSGSISGPQTTVRNGGALVLNGMANHVVVESGGRLSGSGTSEHVATSAGGMLAPGNSVGTLTVPGNLTLAAQSIYEVEINNGGFTAGVNNDFIQVAGTAVVEDGVILQVRPESPQDIYIPGRYTVLTAGGGLDVQGTLTLDENLPYLDFAYAYDAQNLFLDSRLAVSTFCLEGQTQNQCATGDGVFSLGVSRDLFVRFLTMDAAEAGPALDQVSGEVHASMQAAFVQNAALVRNAALDRARTPAADGTQLWGSVIGATSKFDGNGNAASLKDDEYGFLVGSDIALGGARAGVFAGYSQADMSVRARSSYGDSESLHLGAYGGVELGSAGLRAGVTQGWHWVDTRREALGDTLRASFKARTFQAFGELGYDIAFNQASIEPFANLSYTRHSRPGFSEHGGIAALEVAKQANEVGSTELGLRGQMAFGRKGERAPNLYGSAGWRYAFGDIVPESRHRFEGGSSFLVRGVPAAKNSALVEGGVAIPFSSRSRLEIGYSGQFSSGVRSHAGSAVLSIGL